MTAIDAHPIAYETRKRGMSRVFVIAITASLAAHAGVGVYLAYKRFVTPQPFDYTGDPPITMERPPLPDDPDPPKPKNPTPQPNPPPQPRVPVITDILPTIPPLPLPPVEDPKPAPGPTVVNNPTPIDPPRPPAPAVIIKPDWARKPTGRQLENAYPDRAIRSGVGGQATLTCKVTATGAVANCRVTSENPPDYGFGKAALKISQYFVMKPETRDGRPVEGATVNIPVRFGVAEP